MRKNRNTSIMLGVATATATLVGFAFAGEAPPTGQATAKSRLFSSGQPAASEVDADIVSPAELSAIESEAISNYVKRLDVDFDSIDQAGAKYDEYFKQNLVYPKVVRAKVRRLFLQAKENEKKKSTDELDEIVALLQGAIRNGQVQPWMYEAMGLTMQLKEMPKDDIERALMSAADFTDDPRAKLAMASYLSRMGYEDRAVDLYRQVGDAGSLKTETYERVLSIADQIGDYEALEWASLSILGRAARRDEAKLWKRAHRLAQLRLEELKKSGDEEAATKFEKKLKEAVQRDLFVMVRWNGDADVDMLVEEPGGTTCSFRNPRTTGGGVMTGNLADTHGQSGDETHSELYICPKGFAGKYRLILRHVWGRIPSGKVTVDVFGNKGGGEIAHVRRQITMSEDPSMVVFELPEGRRTDSVEQHQLVNDIKSQLAVNEIASNRALLAQQITTVSSDRRSGGRTGGSVSLDEGRPRFPGRTPTNLRRRESVGYRPVISLLPEGRTMSVNAVISADRKYVRITALPFFSQVGNVTEFAVGSPGIGTLEVVTEVYVDEFGNVRDCTTDCILVDATGDVINQGPPCTPPPGGNTCS